MAKTMAQLTDNAVTNMIWCPDSQPETDTLKDPKDRPVAIGDIYDNGKWYRDGIEILMPLEAEIRRLQEENADMKAALAVMGVNE